MENKGSTDRLWSISSRSLLTGKTYAYLSDVCCSGNEFRVCEPSFGFCLETDEIHAF